MFRMRTIRVEPGATHTLPEVVSGYDLSQGPSFTLQRGGSQNSGLDYQAFYCFIASSQRKGAQRTMEPPPSLTSPQPPAGPLPLGRTGPQCRDSLPLSEARLLNSWLRPSLSSQLTLVCLRRIQLEPYS